MKLKIVCMMSLYCTLSVMAPWIMAAGRGAPQFKDSLCEFTWNAKLNNCPDVLPCLTPKDWDGTIRDVPANITRISADSLKLCLQNYELVKPADIIYIIDFSRSMISTFTDPAPGDPHHTRDDALKAGFKYQYNKFPNSRAGYIGFGDTLALKALFSSLSGDHYLEPVIVGSQYSKMLAVAKICSTDVQNDRHCYGTSYNAALKTAIQWLSNKTLCPDEVKAIVFISDGNPDKPSNYPTQSQVDFLVANKVPVHGVYLGNNVGTGLTDLCSKTNGSVYLVPPTNTNDSLAKVVTKIVQRINKKYMFKQLKITNMTNGAVTQATKATNIEDTVWLMQLDNFIPVIPSYNLIDVRSTFILDSLKDSTNLNFRFTINVGGIPPTQECYYCWYKSYLKVLVNNVPRDTLSWSDKNFTIQLSYYGPDTLESISVAVKSTTKGDFETITLTNPKYNGKAFIYEKSVPFSILTPSTVPGLSNGTVEADYQDSLYLVWHHPTDLKDTAATSVKIWATPDSLKLYNQTGDPTALSQYKKPPDSTTVTAGVLVPLYAKIFANVKWLSDYENNPTLAKQIRWSFVSVSSSVSDTSIGTLTKDSSNYTNFYPKKAYQKVDVTASLAVAPGMMLTSTARLSIIPNTGTKLYIEATNDFSKTTPNKPSPWNPILMSQTTSQITAYAILRDDLGNWIGPANGAVWTSENTSVATVTSGSNGSGVINKGVSPSGETQISATYNGISASTTLKTLPYNITAIKIVKNPDVSTSDISSLSMTTNDDTTLYVIGQRSDMPSEWVPINAAWSMTPAVSELPPPLAAMQWTFSPSQPDTGLIIATLGNLKDTVNYMFTAGKPVKISFSIITPDSLLKAGAEIKAVVHIYNEDGLISGTYTYPKTINGAGGDTKAKYDDILGDGGLSYLPSVTTKVGNSIEDS
ncbi:MAG: VWA domain-containing protein, partial [Chitinivibrionales bacterium]|nr:VWA domain-containing protein [Chitinivibrionales bacterium]